MLDINRFLDFIFDDLKKIFFPEEWIDVDLKFSKAEIFSLLLIDKRHEITMSELAEYIHSPLSTATGIADRLTKSGYIIRERSEADRRIVVLRLSHEGSQWIVHLKEWLSGYLRVIVQDLTEEELQLLMAIILKMIRNLEANSGKKLHDSQTDVTLRSIDID